MKLFITILSVSFLFSNQSFALVDYTESGNAPVVQSAPSMPASVPAIRSKASRSSARSSASSNASISLKTRYESINVSTQGEDAEGQVGLVGMNAKIDTGYNFYLDLDYWQASTTANGISDSNSYQAGNPKFLLGFNWFQFGNSSNAVRADIYAGMSLKGESAIAHSRNDKIVGLHSSKKFVDFVLLVGGEFIITGAPKNSDEMAVGNITKLVAGLGWIVSDDIRFALNAKRYAVGQAETDYVGNRLKSDISFSVLNPSLLLNITPAVGLELGAYFRTKRASSKDGENLLDARLMEHTGSYGNTLYSSLNIGI